MATNSVLKLVVDDKEYNASLKNARQGMMAFQQSLEKAGKSFADADRVVADYAREIGKMTTTSTSAKGKISEMTSAFIDFSMQYKEMSADVKSSPIGVALSQSIDQLKGRIISAKKDLKEFEDQLRGTDEAAEQLGTKSKSIFGEGGLTGLLAVTGGNLLASGIQKLGSELADTVQQSIELARAGEGVRVAFERLNQPGLLDQLKEATHGTVSEVELMKQAIKFENFKLPLEDLATYLAFAQQKAKDTGESVDYMVNSITTGLGRQSKQILDNLGISASELTRRMNEGADMTKAVADIIREEMAKAGDYVETAADRAARAAADATNQMEDFGRKAQPVAEQWASTWATIKMGALDLLNNAVTPLINALTEAGRLRAAQQDRGSSGRIAQQINWLQNPGSEGKQAVYERITDSYVDEINRARTEYNKLQKDAVWNPFAAWNADKALAKLNVIKKEYADFKAQAASVMNPKNEVVVNANKNEQLKTVTPTKTIKTGSTKNAPTYEAGSLAEAQAEVQKLTKLWNEAGIGVREQYLKPLVEAEQKVKDMQNAMNLAKEQAQGKLLGDTQKTTITATVVIDSEEALEQLREINGITLDEKTSVVTADTQEALDKLREINGITLDEKTVKVNVERQTVQTTDLGTIASGIPDVGKNAMAGLLEGMSQHLSPLQQLNSELAKLKANLETAPNTEAYQAGLQAIADKEKEIAAFKGVDTTDNMNKMTKAAKQQQMAFNLAGQAANNFGAALAGMEDPAAKAAGQVVSAIASIAMGFAMASASPSTAGTGWGWLAWLGAGMAAMATTISTIHSLTGYAQGGVIKGNSYSGDNIGGLVDGSQLVGLNAGEVILNRSQQSTLASQLQGAGLQNLKIDGVISGEAIHIVHNRYLKRTGQGEILTW